MLQSSMWSQLARLKLCLDVSGKRTMMNPSFLGPIHFAIKAADHQLEDMEQSDKHWCSSGPRSIGAAVYLLRRYEVIAVPTDTIYGLASLIHPMSIKMIYKIKGRDTNKPLAICVADVHNVGNWGVVDDLPPTLLKALLPGPCTLILKRTPALTSCLNPGIDNVGIRVPNSNFIRCVAKFAGPLALTSANESNKPSSLIPSEFSELWPKLGGIFYPPEKEEPKEWQRAGSTIINLSRPGYYSIVRYGVNAPMYKTILETHGLKIYEESD